MEINKLALELALVHSGDNQRPHGKAPTASDILKIAEQFKEFLRS